MSLPLLAVLVLLSAFFAAVEIAIISVGPIKVRAFLREKRPGAGSLSKLKASQSRTIIAILIGNNLVNIAAAAIATVIATEQFGSSGVGIATGVMTLVILVLGDMIPKTFAAVHAERIALAVAGPMLVLTYLLLPLTFLFEKVSNAVIRLVKVKRAPAITEGDIKAMVEFGVEKKIIDPAEQYIIERAVRFSDITVYEVMTPREKIFSVNSALTLRQALPAIVQSGFSRIPVYTGSKRNITGIILAKDVLDAVSKKRYARHLREMATDPISVQKDMKMDGAFRALQDKQSHIALVKDGERIIGLLTLEDLMEELVGEITDESDITPSTIIRINKGTIVAHGGTTVERVNTFFNARLPVRRGMELHELIRRYVRKPRKRAKLRIGELTLVLEDVRDGKILKVRIIRRSDVMQQVRKYIR